MAGTGARFDFYVPAVVSDLLLRQIAGDTAQAITNATNMDCTVEDVRVRTNVDTDDVPSDFLTYSSAKEIAGGAAGPIEVPGVLSTSTLVQVWAVDPADGTGVELTTEFTVTDVDEIDNTDGTATTGLLLYVVWADF